MSIRPRELPRLRDLTLKHLTNPAAPVRARTGAEHQPGLDALARHLRVAELYWVAPDMAALAISAGGQLAAAGWGPAHRPAPCGLIVFEGGVGQLDAGLPAAPQGQPGDAAGLRDAFDDAVPVDACSWGPDEEGCAVELFIVRSRLASALADRGIEVVREDIPPLVPIRSFVLPIAEGGLPMAALPQGAPVAVMAALAASWLLMQQPQLVDRSRVPAEKSVRKAYGRMGLPDPEITVVDLRRQYVPQDQEAESEGGRYRHRWVVSGHWRNQSYGPDRALRRQTWIAAYVKGPDGAPLLATEKVNVWRR